MALRKIRRNPNARRPIQSAQQTIWANLCEAIHEERFTPVVSNSVHADRIFGDDQANAADTLERFSIQEQLVIEWAEQLNFPLAENYKLPLVALFNHVVQGSLPKAKRDYLNYLKQYLLAIGETIPELAPDIDDIKRNVDRISFTELAYDFLEIPQFETDTENTLWHLANLNLPVYITTSHHGFLEKTIKAAGRDNVQTHVYPWDPDLDIPADYLPPIGFQPTPARPVVYHLYGYEEIPESLILSEEDHLDFLVSITLDLNSVQNKQSALYDRTRFPEYVRTALSSSALMLLGYRLQDWEFRVLYRSVINAREYRNRLPSVAIQLSPEQQAGLLAQKSAVEYLKKYFKPPFQIEWTDSLSAIQTLSEQWQQWNQSRS